jgi:HAMP domain-containing protein
MVNVWARAKVSGVTVIIGRLILVVPTVFARPGLNRKVRTIREARHKVDEARLLHLQFALAAWRATI